MLLGFLLIEGVFGQNSLTTCKGADTYRWNNCFGSWNDSNGNKYEGDWKNGMFNGQGVSKFISGNDYVGEFKDGKRNGKGIYTWVNGEKYVGEYKDGKPSGQGTHTWENGQRYSGEHKNGNSDGLGVFTYADGKEYLGEFREGRPNGNGKTIYPDGSKHLGEYIDGQANGLGIKYSTDGRIDESGIYKGGKLVTSQYVDPNSFIQTTKNSNPPAVSEAQGNTPNAVVGLRIALVIGNAKYQISPLRNPINDANDISNALKQSGFEVIDLRDASLQQMRSAVRNFGDRLINSDVGLVYYSGHGIESKGRNYFIPVNTDIQRDDEIADQALDVSLILDKMTTAGKGVNILIVDACRNDPFTRSFRSASKGLAAMDAPKGTIIAYSTSPGKVASDGDPKARNSPYTKALLQAMQTPNRPIEQVFKDVRRSVQAETKNQQTPWENTSLSGDFYFRVQK